MNKLFLWAMVLVSQLSFAASPLENGLVAHYPFSGNANDLVSAKNGTVNGATLTQDRFGNTNSAYDFNGTSNYIQIPSVDYITSQFTFNGWAKIRTVKNWSRFFDFNNGIESDNVFLSFSSLATGKLATEIWNIGTRGGIIDATSTLPLNQWVMVTMVLNGTSIKLYVNGVLVKDDISTLSARTITRNTNYFGRSAWSIDSYTDGSLDDVRIYNRALSTSEITALYNEVVVPSTLSVCSGTSTTLNVNGVVTSGWNYNWFQDSLSVTSFATGSSLNTGVLKNNATYWVETNNGVTYGLRKKINVNVTNIADLGEAIPTRITSGLMLDYPFNGTPDDASGNRNRTVNYGATLATDRFGNANSAYSFDGINGYMTIPANSQVSTTFSFNGWVKLRTIGLWERFFELGNGIDSDNIFLSFSRSGTTPKFATELRNGSTPSGVFEPANTTIPFNQWVMGTLVINGSNVKIYMNGVEIVNETSSIVLRNVTRVRNFLGRSLWGNGEFADGTFDDILMYNRALTASEVTTLYNEKRVLSARISQDLICDGSSSSIVLRNPQAGVSYQLRNGTTPVGTPQVYSGVDSLIFNTQNLNTATTFNILATNGTCSLQLNTTFNVNVNSVTIPTISPSGSTALSLGGSVTLTASGSADAYLWSNGAVTQSIIVSNAGSYSVQAISGECTSSVSAATTVTVDNNLTFNACGTSIVVPATRLGSTVFYMEWVANPTAFSSYKVQWRRADLTIGWSASPVYSGTRSGFKIENLLPNTPYELRFIVTCTATGISTVSNVVQIQTLNLLCSNPVISADTIGATRVALKWAANSGIAIYSVGWAVAVTSGWSWKGFDITSKAASPVTSYRINNLQPNTNYIYRIRVVCATGYGDLTRYTYGTFTTAASPSCTTPTPEVVSKTTNNISLTWPHNPSAAKGYFVRWQLSGASTWSTSSRIAGSAGSSIDYTIASGLSAGLSYNVQLSAICSTLDEQTAWSNSISVSTNSSSTCFTPVIDSLKELSNRSIRIHWTPTTNVNLTEIQYRALGGAWSINFTANVGGARTFSGSSFPVSSGNVYEFRMRVRCADNNLFMAYQFKTITLANGARAAMSEAIINIYPNPSSGLVNVSGIEQGTYAVFNTLGQQVLAGELNSENATLDLSNQANGMYLLKVVSNGTAQTKQIVINR